MCIPSDFLRVLHGHTTVTRDDYTHRWIICLLCTIAYIRKAIAIECQPHARSTDTRSIIDAP